MTIYIIYFREYAYYTPVYKFYKMSLLMYYRVRFTTPVASPTVSFPDKKKEKNNNFIRI